jgi:hypothetical protein
VVDPKLMVDPTVQYTVHDLLRSHPKLFLTYHVISTPFDVFNTIGVVSGAGLYGIGFRSVPERLISSKFMMSTTSRLAVMSATTGLAFGCVGMALGATALTNLAMKGESATPTPFNEDGIKQRVNGLAHNFMVRVFDLSCWSGIGLASLSLLIAGGPSKLKLCSGTLGVLQALSLGSALGGLGAVGCVYSMRTKDKM